MYVHIDVSIDVGMMFILSGYGFYLSVSVFIYLSVCNAWETKWEISVLTCIFHYEQTKSLDRLFNLLD